MEDTYQLGPIRPPSEAFSLLIRVTANCPWNRCRFCNVYKETKFELRSVEDIKKDIDIARDIHNRIKELSDQYGYGGNVREAAAMIVQNPPDYAYHNVALWLYGGGKSAFLQDANTLIMRTPELVEVIKYLKQTFPTIDRITTYGRSKTAAKKTLEELIELRKAGLSRVHIGLESGYDRVLEYMDKGVTAAEHILGGKKLVESGISLSEYVLLGIGGKAMWRKHALETARVLNEINPDFIRMRSLGLREGIPLLEDVKNGSFVRLNDDEVVDEERLLIENLNCSSNLVSDHIGNLLQEVEGKLPGDKEKMLAVIDRFKALPGEERMNFKIGRRAGVYVHLDDLQDERKRQIVDSFIQRLTDDVGQLDDDLIFQLQGKILG